MKATHAGQIVGRALDSWNDPDTSHVGMIPALISPSYYDPAEAENSQADLENLRLEAANMTPYTVQVPFAKNNSATQMSNFGKYSIQGIVSGVVKTLGEFTNIIAANIKAGILLSNEVTTNTLTANQGAFRRIDGSEAVMDSLSVGTMTPDATGAIRIKLGDNGKVAILDTNENEVFSVDAAGNGYFAGTITADKIRVNQIEGFDLSSLLLNATGSSTVSSASESGVLNEFLAFINGVVKFLGDVIFSGHVTVNTDTAGVAVIPSSGMSVDVPFEKPFTTAPIVTISLVLPTATDSAFFAEGVQAAVTSITTTGFTIVLNTPVPKDLTYNWFALAVTNGRKIIGKSIDGTGSVSTLITTPTPSILGDTIVTPSATLTPTLIPTPTLEASPSATPTPLPAVVPGEAGTKEGTPTPTPSGQTVTVLTNELGFVRIRDGPTVEATESGQIPSGTTVPYDDVQYGWYHIVYNAIIGWISGTYVQVN